MSLQKNMPSGYKKKHWKNFASIPYVSADGGSIPIEWINKHNLDTNLKKLPSTKINRQEVRAICQNASKSVLFGYICVMAWGNQGGNGIATTNVISAWDQREKIKQKLLKLRKGGMLRRDSYKLFCGEQKIKGLGPAYWTKLIYFFTPSSDSYIMDQWTSKSINLLTGKQIVRMSGDYVSDKNKGGNYQAYCEEVDKIASVLKVPGDNVEEMLMSGRGKPWRKYLKGINQYNADVLRKAYPRIPKEDF